MPRQAGDRHAAHGARRSAARRRRSRRRRWWRSAAPSTTTSGAGQVCARSRRGAGPAVAGGSARADGELTAREREVAALLADGLTNGQLAERLFISPKTAAVHVSNILAKLGLSSRPRSPPGPSATPSARADRTHCGTGSAPAERTRYANRGPEVRAAACKRHRLVRSGAMGQLVAVTEKPSSSPGVVRFELNRALTGMGHEHFRSAERAFGPRPAAELARRLFATGQADGRARLLEHRHRRPRRGSVVGRAGRRRAPPLPVLAAGDGAAGVRGPPARGGRLVERCRVERRR